MIGMRNGRKRSSTRAKFSAALERLEDRRLLSGDVVLVEDIVAGSGGSNPSALTVANNLLFFRASDATDGTELWRSDGTAAGTFRLKDIKPGDLTSNPRSLTAADGKLYFIADDATGAALWASDGTEAGTVRVTQTGITIRNLAANGSGLYFTVGTSGISPDHGEQLWKSDGTAPGTSLVKDLTPTTVGSRIGALAVVNDTLFFGGSDGTRGRELWKSDGTAAGTVLVKDIVPGATQSDVNSTIAFNGAAYFGATGGLWKSDGTEAGTVLVSNVHVTPSSNTFSRRAVAGGVLLFSGSVTGSELWRSDGTTAGTSLLKDLNGTSASSLPMNFVAVGDTVFLEAFPELNDRQLFMSDGTAAGTVRVADAMPAAGSLRPNSFVKLNDTFYFGASSALYQSIGTPAGTSVVQTLSGTPGSLAVYQGDVYFAGNDGTHGSEPMVHPVNEAPEATGTAVETDEDAPVLIDLRPLASDHETPSADLAYNFTEPDPAVGTLELTGTNGVLRFTPAADYSGAASFSFSVTDNGDPAGSNHNVLTSGTATVGITVQPVNDAPVPVDVTAGVTEDGSVGVALAGSDVETAAGALTFRITSLPTSGTLLHDGQAVTLGSEFVGSPASLTYVAGAATDGARTDSFTYVVTDADAAPLTSGEATVTLNVVAAVADGAAAIDATGTLRVGGTAGNDAIAIHSNGGTLSVVLNGATILSGIATSAVTDARVFARGGDDQVDLSSLGTTAFVNAGAGDDAVTGSNGNDLLIGDLGSDTLTGGSGDDFLIGGDGGDRLVGSSGADVLAAGDMAGDVALAGLRDLAQQWAAAHVASPDDEVFADDTALTDESFDMLTGASGADWFIVGTGDKITDLKTTTDPHGDLVTVVE